MNTYQVTIMCQALSRVLGGERSHSPCLQDVIVQWETQREQIIRGRCVGHHDTVLWTSREEDVSGKRLVKEDDVIRMSSITWNGLHLP